MIYVHPWKIAFSGVILTTWRPVCFRSVKTTMISGVICFLLLASSSTDEEHDLHGGKVAASSWLPGFQHHPPGKVVRGPQQPVDRSGGFAPLTIGGVKRQTIGAWWWRFYKPLGLPLILHLSLIPPDISPDLPPDFPPNFPPDPPPELCRILSDPCFQESPRKVYSPPSQLLHEPT